MNNNYSADEYLKWLDKYGGKSTNEDLYRVEVGEIINGELNLYDENKLKDRNEHAATS